jgi:hypothetical protein
MHNGSQRGRAARLHESLRDGRGSGAFGLIPN